VFAFALVWAELSAKLDKVRPQIITAADVSYLPSQRVLKGTTLASVQENISVSSHMLIWTFFLVLVCGTRAQSLPAPFSYTLYTYLSSPQRLTPTSGAQTPLITFHPLSNQSSIQNPFVVTLSRGNM
jgi:hypothetical protein